MCPGLSQRLPGMHGRRDHFWGAPSSNRGGMNDDIAISGTYWHASRKFLREIASAT